LNFNKKSITYTSFEWGGPGSVLDLTEIAVKDLFLLFNTYLST
jgi:hypothetical protein